MSSFQVGLEHLRQGGHTWHAAWALVNLSQLAGYLGRPDRSGVMIAEALDLMRQTGDPRGMAAAEAEMARFLWATDRRPEAQTCIRRSLSLSKEAGAQIEVARALDILGRFSADGGRQDRAARLLGAAEALVALPAAGRRPTRHGWRRWWRRSPRSWERRRFKKPGPPGDPSPSTRQSPTRSTTAEPDPTGTRVSLDAVVPAEPA